MRVPRSRHSVANGRANPTWTIDPHALARVNRLRRRAVALLDAFSAMPRGVVFAIGLFAVLLVSVVDYVTGPLLSLALLYLIPIVFSAWFLGRGAGNAVAVFATVASAIADQLAPAAPQRSAISYWNDASVLAVFLGVVYLVTMLRTTWTYDNNLVAEVQASLLPAEITQVEGCEIAGEWRPAGVVGGDYYDVLPVAGGSVALCVADVSGKGMPAALLMSNLQAGLRALIGEGLGLSDLVTRLNALIAGNVGESRFITLFLGVLDPLGRRLAFCNAGHNPPILMRPDGSWERLSTGGPVLGVMPRAIYRDEQVTVGPGDRLILYTDGLTERTAANGEEFGDTRLIEVVRANRQRDATGLRDAVVASVTGFGTGSFEDDLTILVVAVT
jgi:serine phosphatase RsbU (regulator of sigma subunit)